MQLSTSEPDLEQGRRHAPMEELIKVELERDKKVTVGLDLDVGLMAELISFLFHNINVFAWKVEDMPMMITRL